MKSQNKILGIKIQQVLFASLVLLFFSCSEFSIEGFDNEKWKEDKNACLGHRIHEAEVLIMHKTLIRGMGQNEIKKFLGSPNKHELYNRNQKIFYYYIEAGPECDNAKAKPKYLSIKFNALDQAGEILIMDDEI